MIIPLVRWLWGQQYPQLVNKFAVQKIFCYAEVAVVDGVKCAAEQTYTTLGTHGQFRLLVAVLSEAEALPEESVLEVFSIFASATRAIS